MADVVPLRSTPRSEPVRIHAVLADGRRIALDLENRGWDNARRCYVLDIGFEGTRVASRFYAAYHTDMVCPDPMMRLEYDLRQIERAVEQHCASAVVELDDSGLVD